MSDVTTLRREHAGPASRRHARLPARPAPPVTGKRERLHAVGAFAILLLIIAGVPTVLLLLVGSPIPLSGAPGGALASTINSTTVTGIGSLVVWIAWAHFVVCVVVEWRSGRRGSGRSPRIPIGAGSRALARRLIAGSLLFSGTAILFAPGVSGPGPHAVLTRAATGTTADGTQRSAAGSTDTQGVLAMPATGEPNAAPDANTDGRYDPVTDSTGVPYRHVAGSALLAAGLVVALAGRRLRGGDSEPVGEVETTLRLAADVGAARFVDQALRVLSSDLTAAGRTLPSVYAATLTDSGLLLHIAPAEPEVPPAPWRVGETPGEWCVDRVADTPDGLPADAGARVPASTPAPYPGLATVGRDDREAHILVDIEGAPGIISLGGDVTVAREVAVSIAVELATNLWSDDLRVWLVGLSRDLTAIAPDRLRVSAGLGEVLDELEGRAAQRSAVVGEGVAAGGVVLHGRQAARGQALWAPDLLVLSEPPADDEVTRLALLAGGRDHGVGVIMVGNTTAARWRFMVSSDRRLSLGVLGLDINAQTLSAHEHAAVVRMFQQTEVVRTTPTETPPYTSRPLLISAEAVSAENKPVPGRTDHGTVPAPTPWVPDIPPWMRSQTATVAPEAATPTTRPPRPPTPPSEPAPSAPPPATPGPLSGPDTPQPHRTVGAGVTASRSAGSRTIPTTGGPAFPPPRSFPTRAAPAVPVPATHAPITPPPAPGASLRATSLPPLPPPPQSQPPATAPPPPSATASSLPTTAAVPPQPPTVPPPGETPPDGILSSRSPYRPPSIGKLRPPVVPPVVPQPLGRRPPVLPPNELPAGTGSGDDALPRSGTPASRPSPPARFSPAPPPMPPLTPVTVYLHRPAETEIRLLGSITVDAPGPLDPERRDLLTELVAYLALHRGGEHPDALGEAIWPGGVPEEAVTAALDEARVWLGPDSAGGPRLTTGHDGCWRLGDDVRCDWDLFAGYAHRSTEPDADTEGDLTTALRLVTGPLWANLPEGRYSWLASNPIQAAVTAAVVDVAHRLAVLTLGYGDTLTAVAACRTGLRAVPTAEVLWHDLLRTVAARGDRKALNAVVDEMYRVIAPPRSGRKVQAETNALVKKLQSGFRRR